MVKKLLATILAIIMCVSQFSFATVAKETGALQFYDDFSGGLAGWHIDKKQFRTEGMEAALYNDNLNNCTAEIAGQTTRWGNSTVTFGIRFLKTTGGIFQLYMRRTQTEYFNLIIRPDKEKSFRYRYKNADGAKSETVFSENYSISMNVDYLLKIVHSDTQTSVYIKENSDGDYTLVGSIDVGFEQKGTVNITTNGLLCKITDFKIYNDNAGDFYFQNKLVKSKIGTEKDIQPINNTGYEMDITYSSSDSSVVSVDESGKLTFLTGGSAVITAKGSIGDIVYSDSFDVISTGNIKTFGFNGVEEELFVGEAYNICAVIRPDNVENKRIIWTTSDSDMLEIVGKMDDEKTLIAKKAGIVYVTIESVDNPGKKDVLKVTIKEVPKEVSEVTFSQDGYIGEIPQYYFGMHSNPLNAISADKNEMLEKEQKNAGYYSDLKLDFIRFMLSDFDWEAGKYPSSSANIPSYSISDIFTAGNKLGIPYIISVGDNDSADKVVAMIKEIKNVTTQPIYIEMGNESWAIGHKKHFATVEDFAERVKEVYTQVKAFDENIKISVPVFEWQSCENYKKLTNPSEQQKRLSLWNDGLLAIKDYYDAVVIHRYSGTESWAKESTTEIMGNFYNKMLSDTRDLNDLEENFTGKEIWITEFGDLPKIFTFPKSYGYYSINDDKYFNVQSESERARLQYGKSVGNAVGYATRLLNFLNNDKVTMASYHCFDDAQCFGVIQDDTKLPNWYMFEKMGEVLDESTHYYKLNADNDNKVTAYGFGDSKSIKKVVFSNLSNQSAASSIGDYKLKKLWSYGDDNPLPDYGTYLMETYTSLPSVIPLPKEVKGDIEASVSLEPYSIVVAEIYDTSETDVIVTNIDVQSDENSVIASCDMYSFAASQNASAYAAVYDEGILKGIDIKNVSISDKKTEVVFATVKTDAEDTIIKIFVWDNKTNKPLAKVSQY